MSDGRSPGLPEDAALPEIAGALQPQGPAGRADDHSVEIEDQTSFAPVVRKDRAFVSRKTWRCKYDIRHDDGAGTEYQIYALGGRFDGD